MLLALSETYCGASRPHGVSSGCSSHSTGSRLSCVGPPTLRMAVLGCRTTSCLYVSAALVPHGKVTGATALQTETSTEESFTAACGMDRVFIRAPPGGWLMMASGSRINALARECSHWKLLKGRSCTPTTANGSQMPATAAAVACTEARRSIQESGLETAIMAWALLWMQRDAFQRAIGRTGSFTELRSKHAVAMSTLVSLGLVSDMVKGS
mmetsp:Transcript_54423/g.108377  ORF Transcript_54423/g.108377 Transcript_54423/m.108377 type:complete len:211 (-) Transcript_54423:851-1483(-)